METTLAIIGWLGAGAVVPAGVVYVDYRDGEDVAISDIFTIAVGAALGPAGLVVGALAVFAGVCVGLSDNRSTIIKGRRK